jgi:hypothetical protein
MKSKRLPFILRQLSLWYQGFVIQNLSFSDQRTRGLKQHSPAGQHHVPFQEEHHIAGNEPVGSFLALS